FDVVVAELLPAEADRTVASPKLSARIAAPEAQNFAALLRATAEFVPDPDEQPPVHSSDPGDDYLLALAAREQVSIVSADRRLLNLHGRAPVLSPRAFLDQLSAG